MEFIYISEIIEAVDGKIIVMNAKSTKEEETFVKETVIEKVSTNSKEAVTNGLFVPIIGERVDAHNFIHDAFVNGAKIAFTNKHHSLNDIQLDAKLHSTLSEINEMRAFIVVEDTLKALQQLATYYRNKFDVPVIGISGSVGKTTTKEMISAALETKYKVLKTFGNMNSQIGVALMMFELDSSIEAAVIEMGISEFHEMECLAAIARPKYAVLTNIGVSHIANLKTRENIRKEKTNIVDHFSDESILFVNGSDDLLQEIYFAYAEKNPSKAQAEIDLSDVTKEKLNASKVMAFGVEDYCTYKAENIHTENEMTEFTYVSFKGREEIHLNVCGIHNVYNALVALGVANAFGIDASVAKVGLESYVPMKMRGGIFNYHGKKVIDDTYNASPDSMKSGIKVLLDLDHVTRRIAILADVLELGEMSKECHYDVGEFIANTDIDLLITVGEQAKFIAQAVIDSKKPIKTYSFENNENAIEALNTLILPGDGILVKGSRGMHTEQIVEYLKDC